jgi:hypothetical protein
MRVLIALLVWAAAIVGAAALSTAVAHSVHTEAAAASFDASKVTATDARSLFRTANFEKALTIIRNHFGANARLDNFVVYPGYLSATVVIPSGEVDAYVNAAGSYQPTTTNATPGDDTLLRLSQVKVDAPATLSDRIATAGHVPKGALAYMVAELDSITHRLHWLVYVKKGYSAVYFQASGATGRLLVDRANSKVGLEPVRNRPER